MKTLFAILLAFAATTANATIFTPTGSSQTPTLGQVVGLWTADGVTVPSGLQVRIKPEQGPSTITATWGLFDPVGGDWFVNTGVVKFTYSQWLALPDEGDGFKTFVFQTTPTYPAPQAGREMQNFLQTVDDGATAEQWSIQTGAISGTPTSFAVTAVPEPSTVALLLPLSGLAWWRRKK